MKNLKLIGFLIIVASSLMFIQCTTDTIEGQAGANGIDGTNGTNGTNGANGLNGTDGLDGADIAVCISCHSNNHRDAIYDAYTNESKHANGSSWSYAGVGINRVGCAQCHNNQGFIDFQTVGYVNNEGYTLSQPISCTGCHSSHRSFDFANDGNDMAMRTLDPVTLITDAEYTIDIKNESDVFGKSNTCVNCHQPRTSAPEATDGKYMQTSTHWGPHHGPQSTMLEGITGFEFSPDKFPAAGTGTHKTNMSCVACHMSTVEEGHSWEPASYDSATCITCHGAKSEVTGFATGMAELAELLENAVGQAIERDADRVWQPVFEADGTTPVEVIGIVHDGHPAVGLFDIQIANAAYNYLYMLEDKSEGVHNPNYAKELIRQSIASFE